MELVQNVMIKRRGPFNNVFQETLDFGEWVRTRRIRKMINQDVLAQMVGMNQSKISRIENGVVTRITPEECDKIIKILSE